MTPATTLVLVFFGLQAINTVLLIVVLVTIARGRRCSAGETLRWLQSLRQPPATQR